jgi:hypothetical protein
MRIRRGTWVLGSIGQNTGIKNASLTSEFGALALPASALYR